jgi:hypothetical protein
VAGDQEAREWRGQAVNIFVIAAGHAMQLIGTRVSAGASGGRGTASSFHPSVHGGL